MDDRAKRTERSYKVSATISLFGLGYCFEVAFWTLYTSHGMMKALFFLNLSYVVFILFTLRSLTKEWESYKSIMAELEVELDKLARETAMKEALQRGEPVTLEYIVSTVH